VEKLTTLRERRLARTTPSCSWATDDVGHIRPAPISDRLDEHVAPAEQRPEWTFRELGDVAHAQRAAAPTVEQVDLGATLGLCELSVYSNYGAQLAGAICFRKPMVTLDWRF
jgi:hypothetical protein